MESKEAGTRAAVVVLLAVLGLMVMVGVILLMMWKQPGIAHSPSEQSHLYVPQGSGRIEARCAFPSRRGHMQYRSVLGS
jgi:hypothetical protein